MDIKAIAFDCFGTIFDMSGVSRDEIKAYVEHVRREDFTPFTFPQSWYGLKPYPDVEEGIEQLLLMGLECVAFSNGSVELLDEISHNNGIVWDHTVDFARHRVYKPNPAAYWLIHMDMQIPPSETLLVTANPTFGDIEGAAAVGMRSQIIRQPGYPQTVIELAEKLRKELQQ